MRFSMIKISSSHDQFSVSEHWVLLSQSFSLFSFSSVSISFSHSSLTHLSLISHSSLTYLSLSLISHSSLTHLSLTHILISYQLSLLKLLISTWLLFSEYHCLLILVSLISRLTNSKDSWSQTNCLNETSVVYQWHLVHSLFRLCLFI